MTSRAGNDRNASPGELDFMHGWMTSRHEGCVSTMLTDKRLKYCTAGAPLQGSGATKWRMQADKHGVSGVFRIDKWADHKLSRSAIRNASRVRLRAALIIQRGSGRLSRQPDWCFVESLF